MAKLRRDQTLLLWATAASLVLWIIPGGQIALAPLALLNTHLHELFHACVALATGGQVSHIIVRSDFSGVTEIHGGWLLAVASAGYVGASLYGGLLVWLGRTPESAKGGLILTGGLTAVALLAFVRGDLTGILSGLGWTVALLGGQAFLKKDGATFAVQFLGIQQALTSVLAFLSLFVVSMGHGHSDAMILQQASGIPAIVWTVAWAVFSAAVLVLCLRAGWNGGGSKRAASS